MDNYNNLGSQGLSFIHAAFQRVKKSAGNTIGDNDRYTYSSHDFDNFPEGVSKGLNFQFAVYGKNLPEIRSMSVILYGKWRYYKSGPAMICDYYEIDVPKTEKQQVPWYRRSYTGQAGKGIWYRSL